MEKVNFSIVKEKIIKTHVVLSAFRDLKNNYDEALQNVERLKSEGMMLKEALKNSTQKLNKANTKINNAQLECAQLEEKLQENDTNKLKKEIKELKAQLAQCACTKIKSLEESCTSLGLQVTELNEKNKKLLEANNMLEEKNDKNTEEITSLKDKLREFTSVSKKQHKLESSIDLIKQNHLNEVASLKNKIEQLTVLESQFKKLQIEYDVVNTELSAIRHQKVIQTCESSTETDDFLEHCFELDGSRNLEDQVDNVEDIFKNMIFKETLLSPLPEDSDIDLPACSLMPEVCEIPEKFERPLTPISTNESEESSRRNDQMAKKKIRPTHRKYWFPLWTGGFVKPKQTCPVKRRKHQAKPVTDSNNSILNLLKTFQENKISCVISTMQETSSSASYYSTLDTCCQGTCGSTKNTMLLRRVLEDTEPQLVGFTASPVNHEIVDSTMDRLTNRLLEGFEKLAKTYRTPGRRVKQHGAIRLQFNSDTESDLEPIFNRLAGRSIAESEDMTDSGLVSATSDALSLDSRLTSGAVTPIASNVEMDLGQLAKRPVLISPLTSSLENSPKELLATQPVEVLTDNNMNQKITSDWVEQVNNQRKINNTVDMDSTAFSICTADLNCSLGNFDSGIFNHSLDKSFPSMDTLQIQNQTDKQDEKGVEVVRSLRNRTITTPKVKRAKRARKRPTTKRFVDDFSEEEDENDRRKRDCFDSTENVSQNEGKKADEPSEELTTCRKKRVLQRARQLSQTDAKERDKKGLPIAATKSVQEDIENEEGQGLSRGPRTRATSRRLCTLTSLDSSQGDKTLKENPSPENTDNSTRRRSVKRRRTEPEESINVISQTIITQKQTEVEKLSKQDIAEFVKDSSLQNHDKEDMKQQRRDSFKSSKSINKVSRPSTDFPIENEKETAAAIIQGLSPRASFLQDDKREDTKQQSSFTLSKEISKINQSRMKLLFSSSDSEDENTESVTKINVTLEEGSKQNQKTKLSLEQQNVLKDQQSQEKPLALSPNCDNPDGSSKLKDLPKKSKNINVYQNIAIVPVGAETSSDFVVQLINDMNKSGPGCKNTVLALPSPSSSQHNIEKDASSPELEGVEPIEYLSPQSPEPLELPTRSPPLIPTERVHPFPASKVVKLRTKLMIFADNDKIVEEVVNELAFQETNIVLQIVFSQLESDVYETPIVATATPLTPPLTKIQSILLGFMSKLERRTHPRIIDEFLDRAEKKLLQKLNCKFEILHPIARLYTAVCKMRRDVERVRRFICENFYFKGDRAAPVLFTILTVWPEVMPMAEESVDKYPLGAIIAQLTYLVTTNIPGYNILALRDLLNKFYGYQRDARNCDEVFEQALIEYIQNPSLKLSELGLLMYLKNRPARWTYQKLEDSFMPLYARIPDTNPNLKATLLFSIVKICLGFDKPDKFEVEALNKVLTWFVGLSEVEGDAVVKEALSLGESRLSKLVALKQKAIKRQIKSQAKLQVIDRKKKIILPKKSVQISNKIPSGLSNDNVDVPIVGDS